MRRPTPRPERSPDDLALEHPAIRSTDEQEAERSGTGTPVPWRSVDEVRSRSPAPRLYIVRHGQTAWSPQGIYSGRRDLPLTDEGRRQARGAAAQLSGSGIDAVYTSPLIRARKTAGVIADRAQCRLRLDDRLLEIDYGPIEGLDRQAAAERFGSAFAEWRARPFDNHLDGMEPMRDALERARSVSKDALSAHRRPALVGHQGILRLVLIVLGRIEPSEYFATHIPEADPIRVEPPLALIP